MHSIFMAGAITAMDNQIKNNREMHRERREYCGGNIRIETYHNYGAFLNTGEKKPFLVKICSILLTLGVLILFILTFTKWGNRELRTGLALLLGGAFSNTYDRIKRGYVVDYVSFPRLPRKLRNIVFNISDFCILMGTCLIVIKQI